jgi:hypothetical protein
MRGYSRVDGVVKVEPSVGLVPVHNYFESVLTLTKVLAVEHKLVVQNVGGRHIRFMVV